MPPENNFDADLSLLLDIARTEYKILFVDDRTYQGGLLKTYLWLSTVMIAAIIALGDAAMGKGQILFIAGRCGWIFFICWGSSLALSLAVFGLGVDALRGRNGFLTFGNFKQLFEIAEEAARAEDRHSFRIDLLRFLEKTTAIQTAETSRTGLRLRKMSYMLLGSTLGGVLAVTAFTLG